MARTIQSVITTETIAIYIAVYHYLFNEPNIIYQFIGHAVTDTEGPVNFNPNATYYGSHFAFKATIKLMGAMNEPSNGNPLDFQLDFNPVRSDICQMLEWYGVVHVGKFLASPEVFMEVHFASDTALRMFLHSKEKVETALKEIMMARFRPINLQASDSHMAT